MNYFPENINDWRKIRLLIDRADTVFITSHVNPDGDAIGCETALADFLRAYGRPVRIINHSPTPDSFRFLDTRNAIEEFREEYFYTIGPKKSDVVFLLDIGKYERAGDAGVFFRECQAPKVFIDHHPAENVEADIVVVNTRAASTGSLLFDLLSHLDASLISREAALSLMTALVTDTGYFRYSNTTAMTHRIASALYQFGVGAIDVRRRIETGYPLCRQILMGLALGTVRTDAAGDVACGYITTEMFKRAGAEREHTDGIIEQIRYIKDIKVAALIIQEAENTFKVSLRAGGGMTINKIAIRLGGGGHPRAAGANLEGTLEEVLARVCEVASSYVEEVKRKRTRRNK